MDETNRLKNVLVPPFDQAFAVLLDDLQQRGRLVDTLVVVMAEFGRTRKLDKRAGRGYWGNVFSVALAGAGVRGEIVLGASGAHAAYPKDGYVEPRDVTATIFNCLGYQPETELLDPFERALPISRGRIIEAIV